MMAALGGMTTAHRVGAARSCVRDRAASHVRACARPSAGFGRNARPLVLCQARPSKPQKVGSSPSPGGVAPKHLNQASAVADPRQARSIDEGDPYVGPRNRAAEPRAEDIAEPARKPKRLTKGEREEIGEKYEWSAWVSTCGVISIAITATYFRLLREVSDGGAFPSSELFAQLALIAGAAVGMEFYARYAHKYLWHDSLWSMSMKDRKEWN